MRDALGSAVALEREEDVMAALHDCAAETLSGLVRIWLEKEVNQQLVECIRTRIDPRRQTVAPLLRQVIETSVQRVQDVHQALTLGYLEQREKEVSATYEKALQGNEWLSDFRGRDILKCFVQRHGDGRMNYEVMRNLILARMRDAGYKPAGMTSVIEHILTA